jgi:nucleotide-binding universal stress UspA family protein
MMHSTLDRHGFVTVAVALDKHTPALVESASQLAAKLGKRLALIHVVEPWAELPASAPFGEGDPLWNVTQAVETSAVEKARARLADIAGMMPPKLDTVMLVLRGKPVEVIVREAGQLGTCLLVVGIDHGGSRFLPTGFSTAFSLLVGAPMPVLAIDATLGRMPDWGRLRLMLADDLGRHSDTAVEFSAMLTAGLGNAELHHVHVNALSAESLRAGLAQAAASAHTPLDERTSAADVYAALLAELEAKLRSRVDAQRDYMEAERVAYSPRIVTGPVLEQLSEAAASVDPDVIAFGRHHAYYTKPFVVGRVPYRAMLAQKRPIIVVPND